MNTVLMYNKLIGQAVTKSTLRRINWLKYRRNLCCLNVDTFDQGRFLLYFSMNYRDFSVKSKLIISLFQTVKLSLSISLFQKIRFS